MEKMILTPEQLYFLGECMKAKYIDYDYIAAMHELQRNYQRSRRKYISDLAQLGLVRERLNGEITVRPAPAKLLTNVFFGEVESTLQVIETQEEASSVTWRFHWHRGDATQVRTAGSAFEVAPCNEETVQSLVFQLVNTAQEPLPIDRLNQQQIQKILIAKRTVVGQESVAKIFFEQKGSLYTTDEAGAPIGVPRQQGQMLLLQALKGE